MKVRYILGISGGKDSAALAIYLKQKYPTMNIEYYKFSQSVGCLLPTNRVIRRRPKAIT